jgi:hypothetical protein
MCKAAHRSSQWTPRSLLGEGRGDTQIKVPNRPSRLLHSSLVLPASPTLTWRSFEGSSTTLARYDLDSSNLGITLSPTMTWNSDSPEHPAPKSDGMSELPRPQARRTLGHPARDVAAMLRGTPRRGRASDASKSTRRVVSWPDVSSEGLARIAL